MVHVALIAQDWQGRGTVRFKILEVIVVEFHPDLPQIHVDAQ
jgi:hypothetical protein